MAPFPSRSVRPRHRGFLMLLALVFGAIFITLLGALSSYVLIENRLQTVGKSQSEAFTIAEAGVQYYKWFLAHYPGDTENGTGHSGPYAIPYNDPEGDEAGTISLSIDGNTSCGQTTSITIASTGTPSDNPLISKTVRATYAQPSVATYSYILNDSVWAGPDRVILGPYHSNGGIRMDGTANSPVTSSVSSWTCTDDFGCDTVHGHYPTENGVFGDGEPSSLWAFPTPQVDFGAIAANFNSLKSTASASGKYWSYSSKSSESDGIHLIFSGNQVTVKNVKSVTSPRVYAFVDGSTVYSNSTDNSIIKSESTVGTYQIPPNCGLIFVENRAWIEGTIGTKVTVAVADLSSASGSADVIIPNNIVYSTYDGSAGLTVIAQDDVLIGPTSPDDMTLNGVFIAQGGAFGRNYYGPSSSYENGLDTLTILGTTVSNKRTGTKWCLNQSCSSSAGYENRVDSYDRQLASSPPPFTPAVSEDYELMDWREN